MPKRFNLQFHGFVSNAAFCESLDTEDSSHDAQYLCEEMETTILKYGVEKFLVAIGDNATNMQAGLRLLHEKYQHINILGCISHLMNLLCGDIANWKSTKTLISDVKRIVKKINRSHKLRAVFNKIQKEKKIKLSLKLPGKTRWGSILFCFQSLLANRNVLELLVVCEALKDKIGATIKAKVLDDRFWTKVQFMVDFLTLVIKINIELEGDGVLMHKVQKNIAALKEALPKLLDSQNMFTNQEKRKILKSLDDRTESAVRPIHLAAALMDPQNCGSTLSQNETIDAMEFVFNTAIGMKLKKPVILSELANFKSKEDIWNKNKDFIWSAASDMCPLQWWKTLFSQTSLSKVATRILSAPISSAATERTNSTYGWIHSNKRNRLTTQRAGKVTYVAHNWKLLNPKKQSIKSSRCRSTATIDQRTNEIIAIDDDMNSDDESEDDTDTDNESNSDSEDSSTSNPSDSTMD